MRVLIGILEDHGSNIFLNIIQYTLNQVLFDLPCFIMYNLILIKNYKKVNLRFGLNAFKSS